jgi:hypothetical protein
MSNADTLIRRAATTASLVLVAVVVATTLQIFWPRLAGAGGFAPAAAAPEPAYRTGDTIDAPAEWFAGSPRTLILFAQASCGACQRAEPFLRALVDGLDDRTAIVMASPGIEREYDRQFGRAIGLDDDAVCVVPKGMRAKVTPTLVVVNERGQVLGAWEGVGPEAQHPALTRAIEAAVEGGR